MIERIPEGIVIHGHVTGEYESECSRCLHAGARRVLGRRNEMFEREPIDGETYPLEGEEIDLELPVRDPCSSICPRRRSAATIAPGCARAVASTATNPRRATAICTRLIPAGTHSAP